MNKTKAKVVNISTSFSIDLNVGGERSSHFVSTTIEFDEDVPVENITTVQMEASYKVAVSVIQNAMVRGALTEDQAHSRISHIKTRFEKLMKAYQEKDAGVNPNDEPRRADS
jgi:hypothetical protein